jgi:uncharacterized protein (DUF2164 family)
MVIDIREFLVEEMQIILLVRGYNCDFDSANLTSIFANQGIEFFIVTIEQMFQGLERNSD